MNQTMTQETPPALVAAFKNTMRRLTATVTVVTSGGMDKQAGMTATAVTSVCMEPPALLVCVNRTASMHAALPHGTRFCVNILGEAHADLATAFGGKVEPEARFNTGEWRHDDHGVPYLADATATVFCIADKLIDYGTHSIVIGKVYAAQTHPVAHPLLYGDGKFLTL